jgi:tetratricopeptide (TPR) repeat protein
MFGSLFAKPRPRNAHALAREEYEWGVAHFGRQDYDAAVQCFTRAIDANPDQADPFYYRGLAWHHKGKLARAAADYTRAIELAPFHADTYRRRGKLGMDQLRFEAAAADLRRATELEADDAGTWEYLAFALLNLKRYAEAFAAADRGLGVNPASVVGRCYRGLAHINLGRPADAIADFTYALDAHPDWAEPLMHRGHCRNLTGQFAQAVADCDRLLQAQPTNADALLIRVQAYSGLGSFEQALRDCDAVLAGGAYRRQEALAYRADALVRLGRFADALPVLNTLAALDPNNYAILINRSQVFVHLKQIDRALGDVERAIALDPNRVEAYWGRAAIRSDRKEYAAALADWDRVLELGSNTPAQPGMTAGMALCGRAHCRYKLGDRAGALADLEHAVAAEPANPYPLNLLAWILATAPDDRVRDGRRAVELARRALAAQECGCHRDTLACALAETGDFAAAVAEAELALRDDELTGEGRANVEQNLVEIRAGRPVREPSGERTG